MRAVLAFVFNRVRVVTNMTLLSAEAQKNTKHLRVTEHANLKTRSMKYTNPGYQHDVTQLRMPCDGLEIL